MARLLRPQSFSATNQVQVSGPAIGSGSTLGVPSSCKTPPARVAPTMLSVETLLRHQILLVLLPTMSNTSLTCLSTSAHLLHQPVFPSRHPRSAQRRKPPRGWTRQTTSASMLLPRFDIMTLTPTTINSLRTPKQTMGPSSTKISISAQPAQSTFLLSDSSTSATLPTSTPQSVAY